MLLIDRSKVEILDLFLPLGRKRTEIPDCMVICHARSSQKSIQIFTGQFKCDQYELFDRASPRCVQHVQHVSEPDVSLHRYNNSGGQYWGQMSDPTACCYHGH